MANYTRNMRQTATYWPPAGNDGFGGVTFGAPVEIKCRWQNKAELARDPDGEEFTSSAVVYPAQPLERQGWLYLGSSVVADPRTVTGAREIRQVGDSPNLRNTKTLNKVWL